MTIFIILLIGYAALVSFLAIEYRRTLKSYNVTHNGYKYVVRDKQGKFVKITSSFWDLLTLGSDKSTH